MTDNSSKKPRDITRREFITTIGVTGIAVSTVSTLSVGPIWAEQKPLVNWQEEWERTMAAAKKEGHLVIAASAGDVLRNTLTKYFNEKYGLTLEWIVGRSAELIPKITAEQKAGIYNTDLSLNGGPTSLSFMDLGMLQSLAPAIFLPEVLDKKSWYGGDLFYFSKEHYGIAFLAFPQPYIFINTDLVKPGEIKGWKDLLNPKWKGKILMSLPTTGAGLECFWSISEVVMSRSYLTEFLKQKPLIVENPRQQCEWVARGKYPILVGGRQENVNEWIKLGSHVELISSIEGVCLTCGAGAVSFFKKAPHPNASKLFINWILTKEGGTILSKSIGAQSARLDVPADFLDPKLVRQPGGKYFNVLTQNYFRSQVEWGKKMPREVFGSLMK